MLSNRQPFRRAYDSFGPYSGSNSKPEPSPRLMQRLRYEYPRKPPLCPKCGVQSRVTRTMDNLRYCKCVACGHNFKEARPG